MQKRKRIEGVLYLLFILFWLREILFELFLCYTVNALLFMWGIKNEFMAIWASMGSEMLGLSVYKTRRFMIIT